MKCLASVFLAFSSAAAFAALPAGFEPLVFIAANGAQYIDTGVPVAEGLTVSIDFMYTRETSRCILGAADIVLPAPKDAALKRRYTVETSLAGVFGGGGQTLFLFAHNGDGVAKDFAFARFYGAKIVAGGKIVRDYVPCRETASGALGLYDLAGTGFHPSAGEKPFFLPWRVGVYGGEGAKGSVVTWYRLIDRSPECDLVNLTPALMQEGTVLKTLDAVVMPGGSSKKEMESLGEAGQENLRAFIANGGCYFGTCAGAHLVLEDELNISGYKRLGYEAVNKRAEIRFNEEGMRELGLTQQVWNVSYSKGPYIKEGTPVPGADLKVWGTYCNTNGRKSTKGDPMEGCYAYLGGTYGKGRMIFTASHPEYRSEKAPDMTLLIQQGFRWLSGRGDITIGDYADAFSPERMTVFCDNNFNGIYGAIEAMVRANDDPRMFLMKGAAATQLNDPRFHDKGRALILPAGVVGPEGSANDADKAAARAFKVRGGLCLFADDGLTSDDIWALLDALASDDRVEKALAWDAGKEQIFTGDRTFEGLDLRVAVPGESKTTFRDGVFAFTPNGRGLGGDWVYCANPLTHRVVIDNARVSAVHGNRRRNSFYTVAEKGSFRGIGTTCYEIRLGDRNGTGGPAVVTFSKGLTIAAESSLSVDAHGKAPGAYPLIAAGKLTIDSDTFLEAATVGVDPGRRGRIVRAGDAVVLEISDGKE